MQLHSLIHKRLWQIDDGRKVVPLQAPVQADNGVKYVTVLLDGAETKIRLDRLKAV